MFIQQPFDEFLGFQYERVDEKSIKVTLPVKPLYLNSVGAVHGGIISSLSDVAMCNTIEPDENNIQQVVTIDLNVSFLKKAKGEYLVAHASVVKEGHTLTHVDCFIYDDKENVVAKANGIFFNS
ncbi:PaaI family thioesterase [Anaerobacillus sp. MEB173]|uniref:PaaI family thioesterase n=1 Tax=Anaerobacillus sp. MEB173 TaxID=3383345 RepID=UPI003F90F4FC